MKLFTDVRIGKRLGIGFGITLCLMVVIVIMGIVSLRGINRNLDRMVEVNTAKIKHANYIRRAFADITYLVGQIVTSQEQNVRERAKKRIDEIRANYKKSLEGLEKLEINEEGKNLIAKLKEEVTKGREANNLAIELGMSGNTKEGTEKYGALVQVVEGYIQAAEAIVRYNEDRIQYRYEEAKQNASTTRIVFILLGVINLCIGIFFSVAITRSIAVPIMRSSSHIDMMAKGDFSISISEHAINRKDELGVIAQSMDTMNRNLGLILKEVKVSASSVASASTQLNTFAENLSKGALDQVERATQVAASSEEMSQTSLDIAKNTNSISESAKAMVSTAEKGSAIVNRSVDEVKEIAKTVQQSSEFVKELGNQSEKIGEIINVINDIADQTNLLALNAAIEAARAGEAGRGFAVVADEVKKLAERTGQSTQEIGDMVRSIKTGVDKAVGSMDEASQSVKAGVELSNEAGGALHEIVGSASDLQSMVQQIAAAIEEMNSTTDEIAKDIEQVTAVTKETSSSAERVTKSAVELNALSIELEGSVKGFKLDTV